MSDIVQLYSDKSKTKKAYPKTLASETYMSNGGTVESQLAQIENKNIEQDARLKKVEYRNKVQDVYINGLFNENKDGRLSVEGEGNSLKLEGSKEGLVEIDKVVGNTFVNLCNRVNTSSTIAEYEHLAFTSYTLKPSTCYTFIVKNNSSTETLNFYTDEGTITIDGYTVYKSVKANTTEIFTFTTKSDVVETANKVIIKASSNMTDANFNLMIFEGDLTANPPTEYVEGLQSSFESNLVTQEMIDAGLEDAENLGKYKVPVKLVGKNLINPNRIFNHSNIPSQFNEGVSIYKDEHYNGDLLISGNTIKFGSNDNSYKGLTAKCNLKPNTKYTVSYTPSVKVQDSILGSWNIGLANTKVTRTFVTDSAGYKSFTIETQTASQGTLTDFQLEEGTVATSCEDFFERNANVYINSPLLEGDEIVMHNGDLCHYHKYNEVVLNGYSNVTMMIDSTNNTSRYRINNVSNTLKVNSIPLCDKFVGYIGDVLATLDVEGISTHSINNTFDVRILNSKLSSVNVDGFKNWLQANPITVVYQLSEPWYEPISSDKLLLECANDSTLHIDSIVPVESIKASYTGNVPSVYGMDEDIAINTEDISVTQTAVDFLLMSSMGEVMMMSFNENTKGGNQMGAYFASRIMKGALKYEDVIRKYPEFKEDIDFILRSEGYGDLIVEVQ